MTEGAEVVRRAETARRWGGGGPCCPCLGRGPGRSIRGRSGAALRLSSSLAVAAAAARAPRLRTRGSGSRLEAVCASFLPPAWPSLPRPQGEELEAGRRAAGGGPQLGLQLPSRSGRRVPMVTAASPPLTPPPDEATRAHEV